jgi:hypothetical protein
METINKQKPPCEALRGRKLYHYTSFESFVKIWLSQKILFGSIENVNDFMEYKHTVEVNNPCCLPLTEAFNDVRMSFRQLSFTLDDDQMEGFKNPMMWGQYANKGRGVCMEFDFNKLFLNYKDKSDVFDGFVCYKDKLPKLPPINGIITRNDIRRYILRNKEPIMFTKFTVWDAENEYRIVSDNISEIEIDNTISAVYLTSCLSDECVFVEKLLENTNVPVWTLCVTTDMLFSQIQIVDPQKRRNKIKESCDINSQAKDYYQRHKNDCNASLIMDSIKLKSC